MPVNRPFAIDPTGTPPAGDALAVGGSVADTEIYPILERVAAAGGRLEDGEAARLLESADLVALGRAAHAVRMRLHPRKTVTFVIDRNINYTNICVAGCAFCAFHRAPGAGDGWVITREELRRKIEETYAAGGSQILMQGGLNPDLTLEWHEELLRWLRGEFPGLHIHAYSPPEIAFLSKRSGRAVDEVLRRLAAAGLNSIPGGGAEILTDRVRARLSPGKVGAGRWIEVMRAAHRLGLRTTATMMYGLIETVAERVEHLRRLRDLQGETGGFTAFINWPFQPRGGGHKERFSGAFDYLRMTAVARLYLDNIPNIQASWVTQGEKIAQLSLAMGVNDLGSLMLEENVVAAAGTHHDTTKSRLRALALEMGYELRQRDFYYRPWRQRARPAE
ncbi:MAG: dehypoxanthine futalosine cyclase [bacterium]|nr:dehypoxanthine futalosine cyclase [bacterium]